MKNLKNVKALVFDMDGTIYTGDKLIPGARETLWKLKDLGKRICYLTNNSSRCGGDYLARLLKMGFPAEPADIVTSGDVALRYVETHYPGKRVIVLGTKSLKSCFSEQVTLDEDNPEVAVMGFHNELTFAELVKFCNALRSGIPYLVTHPDKSCPADPYPVPDAGSFALLIESSVGRKPDAVCGKPTVTAGEYLKEFFGLNAEEIAFVGDRYSTDIMLAKNNGFLSVHVQTGAQEEYEEPADFVLPTVNDILNYV